jgi:hypothetical protein
MYIMTLSPGARLNAVRLKDNGGNEIGKVIEWMMDVEAGKVIYIVATLHNNHEYFAIPWQLMKADLDKGGYIVDEQLVTSNCIKINRDDVPLLVDRHDLLEQILNTAEGNNNQPAQNSSPDGTRDRSRPDEGTTQSNAVLGEGKGYGG